MSNRSSYRPSIMAQISHEIRIPLTGIMGMTYCLNKTLLTPEQKTYVTLIEASAKRLQASENNLYALFDIYQNKV